MTKAPFDRRRFLADSAKLAAGAQLGVSCLGYLGHAFGASLKLGTVFDRVALGDTSGMAFALADASPLALVHVVLIDKVQAALFQQIPGDAPLGADGQDGAAQKAADFRGMGLNKLFADSLAGLPDGVALSVNNAWESGNAGHNLGNSVVSAEHGGVNNAFEKLTGGSGLLGAVGFGLRSSALDSSDAFTAAGGKRLQTFGNVGGLTTTLKNSVSPLLAGPQTQAMVKDFDALVTKDTSFRDALTSLASRIQSALPELDKAKVETDAVMQQVKAIIALYNSGACRNFMLAVPWQDTNANGNLTTAGGSLNLNPFEAVSKIGKGLVALHAAIPNLICVSTSDGGRSLDNGDQSAGFAFLTGASAVVKNGVIGGKFTDTKQLGSSIGDIALSNGEKKVARPAQWYATALKAAGLDAGVEHVPEALTAG